MTELLYLETSGAFFPVTRNHITEERMLLLIFTYCYTIIHTVLLILFAAFREMDAARLRFLGAFGKLRSSTSTPWAQYDLWTDVVKPFVSFLKKELRILLETP
jgi:hypothetical protein